MSTGYLLQCIFTMYHELFSQQIRSRRDLRKIQAVFFLIQTKRTPLGFDINSCLYEPQSSLPYTSSKRSEISHLEHLKMLKSLHTVLVFVAFPAQSSPLLSRQSRLERSPTLILLNVCRRSEANNVGSKGDISCWFERFRYILIKEQVAVMFS